MAWIVSLLCAENLSSSSILFDESSLNYYRRNQLVIAVISLTSYDAPDEEALDRACLISELAGGLFSRGRSPMPN